VRAIADFKSAKQEELNFSKGDVILVLEKPSPEWWKGELNGKTGLFPRSHVLGVSSGNHFDLPLEYARHNFLLHLFNNPTYIFYLADPVQEQAERRLSRAVAPNKTVLSAIGLRKNEKI